MASLRTMAAWRPRPLRSALVAGTAALALGLLLASPSGAYAQVAPDAAAEARTISATGTGQVTVSAANLGGSLMMSVQEYSNGTDVIGAVRATQARIEQLRVALTAAGVPAASIQVQSFNISPMYGYPGPYPYPYAAGEAGAPPPMATAVPVKPPESGPATAVASPAIAPPGGSIAVPPYYPGRPPISTYVVNAQVVAETSSPEMLGAAMSAAINSGVQNVNTYTKGPSGPAPSGDSLAAAIGQATLQAKTMAEASAAAAGVTLGPVRSVTVLPVSPYYGGPMPTATWQVQVRVTYDIR